MQSFHNKGALHYGVPGNSLVLRRRRHDGRGGTDADFHYRLAYIDPALIQNVLASRLSSAPRLYRASENFVQTLDHPRQTLEEQDAVRIEGEFVWHSNPKTDESFVVQEGTLRIDLSEGWVYVQPGEFA